MDKSMAADLDRHLTTEPSGPVEYEVGDIPAIRALETMLVTPDGGYFEFEEHFHLDRMARGDNDLRKHLYEYYANNSMASSLFGVGWEAGIERQPMRIVEADELNEGDEIDDAGEARFYYLHGYVAGQLASYKDPDGIAWETPWAATSDDEFFEEV